MKKLLLILLSAAGLGWGQCGQLVMNPISGRLDCIGASGSGSVTSVGLAGTANQITVTGASPITGSGSWTLSLPSVLTLPGTVNKLTITAPATGSTLTIADGKTFTSSNTITLTGTDGVSANVSNMRLRSIGMFFDGGGVALANNQVKYYTWTGGACTIAYWTITADTGTITYDIWKIATGTAIPTVSNTIVASAAPALATGTAIKSTTMTGWTTSVADGDIFGFKITAISGATQSSIVLQCAQ